MLYKVLNCHKGNVIYAMIFREGHASPGYPYCPNSILKIVHRKVYQCIDIDNLN